jgi:DNA-binding HxlR family transcriptional regulator
MDGALTRTRLRPGRVEAVDMTEQDSELVEGLSEESGHADARRPAHAWSVDWDRVVEVITAVNGAWALPILRALASGTSRPGEILRAINADREPGSLLSQKVMLETLGRMIEDGLVHRAEVQRTVPRETHYSLTPRGHAILTALSKLGAADSTRETPNLDYKDPPAPSGIDITRPNPARIWNALIGGKDNYAADRVAVREIVALMPKMPQAARLARRFQADAVRRLVADGARQFIDIGTGLPVAGAVHEIAQESAPEARVVYVDNDPMVQTHGRALLRSEHGATDLVEADIREPGKILADAARTLDMDRPVAVILMMILHFIPDADDPWGIVRHLLDGLPAGSWLVIGHVGADIAPRTSETTAAYNQRSPVSVQPRTAAEVTRFFTQAGAALLPPGLVPLAGWWPAENLPIEDSNAHVGIGRGPAQGRP